MISKPWASSSVAEQLVLLLIVTLIALQIGSLDLWRTNLLKEEAFVLSFKKKIGLATNLS
jgi:hypothetical protein